MGCVAVVGGLLAVSVGAELDPAICVTETAQGKCVCRRALSYAASCLAHLGLHPGRETIVAVGGVEGELDLFSIVVLTATAVEIRLVYRVSGKINRNARVAAIVFDPSSDILAAVAANGGIRRWRLGLGTSGSMPHRLALSAGAARAALSGIGAGDSDRPRRTATTRLSASDRVVNAQRILASILQDEAVGVTSEAVKDELVNQFSATQAQMCEAAGQCDRELRRAQGRILRGRFGVEKGEAAVTEAQTGRSPAEEALAETALTTTAAELHVAGERHREQVGKVLAAAVSRFQRALQAGLRNAQGGEEELARLRVAIGDL